MCETPNLCCVKPNSLLSSQSFINFDNFLYSYLIQKSLSKMAPGLRGKNKLIPSGNRSIKYKLIWHGYENNLLEYVCCTY